MTVSTVASMNSKWISQIYADALFVARARNVMATLVTPFMDRTGDEARASLEYPQVAASAIADGTDFSGHTEFTKAQLANLTPGEIIAQVVVTDRRLESDPQNARADASRELGEAIADKVETDLLAAGTALTGGGGTVGTGGTADPMTWGKFFAARTRLAGTKVPGPYALVLHEYQWHNLAKSASVAGAQTNAAAGLLDEVNRRFYVATVGDVDIFTTANIAAGTAVKAFMFNRAALAFDSRRAPRLEPERDASLRAWELNMTAKYATGVWRPAFGVQILSDASVPTG